MADLVQKRARQAAEIGLDGIVCAPGEVTALRRILPAGMALVTPGIRPAHAAAGDQKRAATPADAIRAGADYLVVGRPITEADDPGEAARAVVAEMEAALSDPRSA